MNGSVFTKTLQSNEPVVCELLLSLSVNYMAPLYDRYFVNATTYIPPNKITSLSKCL